VASCLALNCSTEHKKGDSSVAPAMAVRVIALTVLATVVAGASAVHPIGKVITLLNKLKDQAIEEGRNEEALFAKFSYYCKTSTSDLKKAIAEEKATIDELDSSIKGFKQEKKALGDQIKELSGEIKDLQSSANNAKSKDVKRHKTYLETKTDLKNTIKSIGDAIGAMDGASKTDSAMLQEGARKSVGAALAFLSMKATDEQQTMLVDFVGAKPEKRPDQKVQGDEKKHVKKYSFKSDNVIDLLKNLKLKFEDDYTELTKDETSGANGYTLEKEARDNAEKAADKSKKQKQGNLAETSSSLAEAEGNLKDQKADFEADSASLAKTDNACSTKTREWEERSKTRSGEIEAIGEATKILAKVSGVRTGAPSNPVLPSSPVFLQIVDMDPKAKAVQLLRATAKTVHSKALEQLALEVSTHLTGPFDKVNGMIQKMVFRLMAEQTDEDKHKAWCDLELEKTKKSSDDKTDKLKDLNAKIKSENAKVAEITSEVTTAQKMISDITAFMAESIEIRTAGKRENTISIKEAKQAQTAIANAVSVLQDFYKSSGEVKKEPWEFVQLKAPVKLPKDPKLWDSSYTGVADPKKASTGVIAILEAVAADFSKMEAETKAQEVEDQKKFDDSQKAHKIEKARRQQESDTKTQEKKRKIGKIESMTAQKKHTSDELEAVEKYNKDLQPACVKGDSTFGDRKAARAKEIKALKDAQGLLQTAFKKKGASFLQMK